jgi:hypothetical protein
MAHGSKGGANGPLRGAGPRQAIAMGHGDKRCARCGPRQSTATAMGEGGSRAYIRGDGGRRPPCLTPPPLRLSCRSADPIEPGTWY